MPLKIRYGMDTIKQTVQFMVFARSAAAAFLALAAGCATAEPPPVTDRSVWWAPLAAWSDYDLSPAILDLLQTRGIDVPFISGRGVRIWAPWERHAEAVELLRASPHAAKLKIHTLRSGPRPDAVLPKLEFGDEGASWTSLAHFKLAEVPIPKLQAALQAENIEVGVVVFGATPEIGRLFVPDISAGAARRLLKTGPWAEVLVFPP